MDVSRLLGLQLQVQLLMWAEYSQVEGQRSWVGASLEGASWVRQAQGVFVPAGKSNNMTDVKDTIITSTSKL